MLNIMCVQVGPKYPFDHVIRLRNMVARHLPVPFRFHCLTDQPQQHEGIECIDVSAWWLRGWWNKMLLFNREIMPEGRMLYFDLDTVITGDLTPLYELVAEFLVCGNFTRAAGNPNYPCRYGSCVMSIGPQFGQSIWNRFAADQKRFIQHNPYGDQQVVEQLYPSAFILQDLLPPGYFLGYREIGPVKPEGAAVVVFGGHNKPHNCKAQWVREAWQ